MIFSHRLKCFMPFTLWKPSNLSQPEPGPPELELLMSVSLHTECSSDMPLLGRRSPDE